MYLQLYAITVMGRSHGSVSLQQQSVPYERTVNCLLQVGDLSADQTIEVQLKSEQSSQQIQQTQLVFAWMQHEQTDEIVVRLRHHGQEIASWQGIWMRNVFFHTGALPVQVFLDGALQADGPRLIPIDVTQQNVPTNGHSSAALPDVIASLHQPAPQPGTTQTLSSVAIEERSADLDLQEPEPEKQQHEEDDELEDLEGQVEDNDVPQPKAERPIITQDDLFVPSETEAPLQSMAESVFAGQAGQTPPAQSTPPPGPRVLAFHASSAKPAESVDDLDEQLKSLPKKTVLVDLRETPRGRSQSPEYGPLSRAYLRDTFGGKYWDRASTVRTEHRTGATARSFRRVVTNQEDPNGILYLEQYLLAGYTMIFLDSWPNYEESTRRAVIEALQHRMPTLQVTVIS